MDFRNCPQCGKIFRYVNRNLCLVCQGEEEKMYDIVRQYVRDNHNSNVIEVSEATGVPKRIIMNFLREGRLLSTSGSLLIECQSCGTSIAMGQFCESCTSKMTKEIRSKLGKPEPSVSSGQRMHTAEFIEKKIR